jgi:hypothetical protein
MNCAECRDNLVARLEGLLDAETSRQCEAHLESCEACRAEYAAAGHLQDRLVARGRKAAEVSLVEPVMRAVRKQQSEPERTTLMSLLIKNRWGFGLGAAASVAAIILIIALATPNVQAKAVEVMAKGAQAIAKLTTIHLRGQIRTQPADNFSFIDADNDFYPIELWKQFEPDLKWRVEKPGRVAVMDGQQTMVYIKPGKVGYRIPRPAPSAFDTEWLQQIANLSNTLSNELRHAQAQGWKLDLKEETAADGRPKCVVSVWAKSGVPDDDYGKNSFLHNADTRRVYHFDAQSERLEAVQIYLLRGSGEVQIFDLSHIDYDQPIEPAIWKLDLPADVNWVQETETLPDNARYASMTAEEAARAFFGACGREDWNEAGKFMSPITDRLKQYLGGVEVVSLGQAFTSKSYPGRFIPYEIRLHSQELNLRLANTNAAGRYVITGIYDRSLKPLEQLRWTKDPEMLPNNDTYAKMSALEAAKAYFAAQSKCDWAEMGKFAPESDVENDKRQLEAAQKQGMDARKIMPVMEVVDATWSAEQSAYFVKFRMSPPLKKHNLALRKDNKAGRWQVDGGI